MNRGFLLPFLIHFLIVSRNEMPGEKWSAKEERKYLDLLKEGKKAGRMGERFKADFYKECVAIMKPEFPLVNSDRLNSKRAS